MIFDSAQSINKCELRKSASGEETQLAISTSGVGCARDVALSMAERRRLRANRATRRRQCMAALNQHRARLSAKASGKP